MINAVFFFRGGAYAEHTWTQITPPDDDQWGSWSCGELEILKVDADLRIWEPEGKEEWKEVRARPSEKEAA